MSFPRYPKYKASGVDWLGDVPEHWEVERFRWFLEIKKRIAGELGHDVLSITQQGIKVKDLESNIGQLSMDYSKYQFVEAGDFAMNHMDLLTGYVDISNQRGVTSPDYRVFSIRDSTVCYDKYLLFFFQMGYKNKIFYAFGQGSSHFGRWRLPTEQFNNLRFPLPSFPEQTAIAEFLDRETAKIDGLVAEQRRLMELLKEKRQAVISHAVTKGLNQHAPMKPSGIEWLGDIPAGWEVLPLRRSISFLTDYEANGSFADTKDNVQIDIGEPYAWYVRATDLENKRFGLVEGNRFCDEKTYKWLQKTALEGGELLVAKRGEIGKAYTMPILKGPATLAPNLYLIRLNQKLLPLYAWYWFSVDPGKAELVLADKSTTIGALYKDDVKSCIMLTPPLPEQVGILEYPTIETAKFDTLAVEAQRAIDLLQERRTALISAAVTGQIDVRQQPRN